MPSSDKSSASARSWETRRLAHAELIGELLHGALLEEVADHDVAQPLGQRRDRVGEVGAALAVDDRVFGCSAVVDESTTRSCPSRTSDS